MYYAVLLVDIDSLRSTRCEELRSSRIPPDPNETSAMARHTPMQYSSDTSLYSYYFLTCSLGHTFITQGKSR